MRSEPIARPGHACGSAIIAPMNRFGEALRSLKDGFSRLLPRTWGDAAALATVLAIVVGAVIAVSDWALGGNAPFSVTGSYAWAPEDAVLFAFQDRLTAGQQARVLALRGDNASASLRKMGGVRFGRTIWRGPSTESSTRVEVVVERHGTATATIVGIHAVIIRRSRPLAGAEVTIEPQGDGKVTNLAIDLDSPNPIARDQGAHESLGSSHFPSNRVTVAENDPATFVVQAYTHRFSYEWELAIDVIVDGQFRELYASDGGHPFRSTAQVHSYGVTDRFNPTVQRFERVRP